MKAIQSILFLVVGTLTILCSHTALAFDQESTNESGANIGLTLYAPFATATQVTDVFTNGGDTEDRSPTFDKIIYAAKEDAALFIAMAHTDYQTAQLNLAYEHIRALGQRFHEISELELAVLILQYQAQP